MKLFILVAICTVLLGSKIYPAYVGAYTVFRHSIENNNKEIFKRYLGRLGSSKVDIFKKDWKKIKPSLLKSFPPFSPKNIIHSFQDEGVHYWVVKESKGEKNVYLSVIEFHKLNETEFKIGLNPNGASYNLPDPGNKLRDKLTDDLENKIRK